MMAEKNRGSMRSFLAVVFAALALVSSSVSPRADAFVPHNNNNNKNNKAPTSKASATPSAFVSSRRHILISGGGTTRTPSLSSSSSSGTSSTSAKVVDVPTHAIPGMKPGTSGLRKKVEVWQALDASNEHYLENFIQSLLDTATAKNDNRVPQTYVLL